MWLYGSCSLWLGACLRVNVCSFSCLYDKWQPDMELMGRAAQMDQRLCPFFVKIAHNFTDNIHNQSTINTTSVLSPPHSCCLLQIRLLKWMFWHPLFIEPFILFRSASLSVSHLHLRFHQASHLLSWLLELDEFLFYCFYCFLPLTIDCGMRWSVDVGGRGWWRFLNLRAKGCLLSTTSSFLIPENIHNSSTLAPHPWLPAPSSARDFPESPCPAKQSNSHPCSILSALCVFSGNIDEIVELSQTASERTIKNCIKYIGEKLKKSKKKYIYIYVWVNK